MRAPTLLIAFCLPPATATAQGMPDVPMPPGPEATEAQIQLGKALFWDEQLSSDDTVACGTCHQFAAGGSDPRTLADPRAARHPGRDGLLGTGDDVFGSPGIRRMNATLEFLVDPVFGPRPQVTPRRARTVLNAAHGFELFWDGRAGEEFLDPLTGTVVLEWGGALETQALQPILNTLEMAHEGRTWSDVSAKLERSKALALSPKVPATLAEWIAGRSYPALFQEVFGADAKVEPKTIGLAIAAYERTLIADQAPVLVDTDRTGWSELEQRGEDLFLTLPCSTCHDPSQGLFTDQAFHQVGTRPTIEDAGLADVTGLADDRGRFLTPSLLNVQLRAPYFHAGSAQTLEEAVAFYVRGGDFFPKSIGPLRRVTKDDERALVAYLGRPLTDPRLAGETGPFERPLLRSERKE